MRLIKKHKKIVLRIYILTFPKSRIEQYFHKKKILEKSQPCVFVTLFEPMSNTI